MPLFGHCLASAQRSYGVEGGDSTGSAVQTLIPLDFTVTGRGTCGELTIDWEDDSQPEDRKNQSFPFHSDHRYDGWGGGKTVTVHPALNCGGFARTRLTSPQL